MVATSGDVLLEREAEDAMRTDLIPMADVLTPNLPEAARLLGQAVATEEIEMRAQARALHDLGPSAVLIKGGHGEGTEVVDTLFDGTRFDRIAVPRVDTKNTHGTGCTLSSAIAACLGHGASIRDSVFRAKIYLSGALEHADELHIGSGSGPVHHMHDLWRVFDET